MSEINFGRQNVFKTRRHWIIKVIDDKPYKGLKDNWPAYNVGTGKFRIHDNELLCYARSNDWSEDNKPCLNDGVIYNRP